MKARRDRLQSSSRKKHKKAEIQQPKGSRKGPKRGDKERFQCVGRKGQREKEKE